jgi:hypothetical protein
MSPCKESQVRHAHSLRLGIMSGELYRDADCDLGCWIYLVMIGCFPMHLIPSCFYYIQDCYLSYVLACEIYGNVARSGDELD